MQHLYKNQINAQGSQLVFFVEWPKFISGASFKEKKVGIASSMLYCTCKCHGSLFLGFGEGF